MSTQSERKPRVAILGNMNNVGFVLLRLLREAGVDAHLLMYANDGVGGSSHFSPENDTEEIESWAPFIRRVRIHDHLLSTVAWPLASFYWVLIYLASILGKSSTPPPLLSRATISEELEGFDVFIGSGPSPAILRRVDRALTVFWPYSQGVEYIAGVPFRQVSRWYSKVFFWLTFPVRRNQELGIRRATKSVVGLDTPASLSLESRGIEIQRTFIPMVFGGARSVPSETCRGDAEIMNDLRSRFDLVCFSAVRQYWGVKRNDMFLRGFGRFVERNPGNTACLVFMDYGPDVDRSRQLIEQLGFADRVFWLSRKGRNDVRFLSTLADVCVGQFEKMATIWGCIGWEALADGKPLLTGFKWEGDSFTSLSGVPAPPILGVKNEDDVLRNLEWAHSHPEDLVDMGVRGKAWFQEWQLGHVVQEWVRLASAHPAN